MAEEGAALPGQARNKCQSYNTSVPEPSRWEGCTSASAR
jgi:hypothetical protein